VNEHKSEGYICVQESDVAGSFYTSASTPSGEVRCPLPSFDPDDPGTLKLYNWSVSVSNDNATWSDSVQVLVYDQRNVTCHDDGNGTYQCRCLPSVTQVKLSPVVAAVGEFFRKLNVEIRVSGTCCSRRWS